MYESEGEYNAAMSAQAEAEAEYQAHCDYLNYLDNLLHEGKTYEYQLRVIADALESDRFKNSGKTPSNYLRELADNLNKPAHIEQDRKPDDLPF